MTDISKEAITAAWEEFEASATPDTQQSGVDLYDVDGMREQAHAINDIAHAQSARIAELEAQQCVEVKPLEWDKHPDDIEFYALPNDDGDCLYVVYGDEDEGAWFLKIGGENVQQDDYDGFGEKRDMWWPSPDRAKDCAQHDLNSRLRRIVAEKSAAEVRAQERADVIGEVEGLAETWDVEGVLHSLILANRAQYLHTPESRAIAEAAS